ncbi:MAG TPA: hypothetical protein ENH31_07620 [Nitrospirae bacterium]|nr:archaeal ATPase [bacterium BMS3Abin10]GBE37714.1 archaeal ATPase [bacterium BMS3Bbin08]HDK82419.1 hypothetical protein [Nitrospirota bacterium]
MPFKTISENYFMGRAQELQSLSRIASEAAIGTAASIFLSGQTGAGKTELLRRLFADLFHKHEDAAPFFYTVNPALISARDLSNDYLSSFMRQRLAFQQKDLSLALADELSVEDLMRLAEKLDSNWAVDILGRYLQARRAGTDPEKLFLSAIKAPHLSYFGTGVPVVVMIDNFHSIRGLYRSALEDSDDLWMLFEDALRSGHTPHLLTGSRHKLDEMFFEKTSFGSSLELVYLSGLDNSASLRLLSLFHDDSAVKTDDEHWAHFIDLFNGNPSYIKTFSQAARRHGRNLAENDLWKIYFREITSGKIYTTWMSRLKACVPELELRKASIELLRHLSRHSVSGLSDLAKTISVTRQDIDDIVDKYISRPALPSLSISRQDFHSILKAFRAHGIVEKTHSTFRLAEDRVMSDFINALYSREVLDEPLDSIEEAFIRDKAKHSEEVNVPSFKLTIPAAPRAEIIAVKALEQIARNYNVSAEITAKLQAALIDLFVSVVKQEDHGNGSFQLKFECSKETFKMEIKTPDKRLIPPASFESISDDHLHMIRKYVDDIRFEETKDYSKIILTKNLTEKVESPG